MQKMWRNNYYRNQKDMLIEMKNQIDNIINLYDINDIIRKIKFLKIILDNIISEKEKNIKNIQNMMNDNNINNINLLNKNPKDANIELIYVDNFEQNEQNVLENFVVESISKTSDFSQIASYIYDECQNWNKGIWAITVGEKNKFNSTNNTLKALTCNISSYKILINYSNISPLIN